MGRWRTDNKEQGIDIYIYKIKFKIKITNHPFNLLPFHEIKISESIELDFDPKTQNIAKIWNLSKSLAILRRTICI